MSERKLKLGLFGFGCVGQGLHTTLSSSEFDRAEIHKICIQNIEKERSIDKKWFTDNPKELLFDPEIDVIVELIDDAEAALEIVTTALKNKKPVVSANKKLIAEHLELLIALQQENNTPLLYEGACCASIPIIRNLEEYYDNDLVQAVEGIFNGSTNYILSSIERKAIPFDKALKEAQDKGFAETDPSLDIDGFDPKYKLCILLAHAFGLIVRPENIFHSGISRLKPIDSKYAKEKGHSIKLIANCFKSGNDINAYVIPKFIQEEDNFTNVKFENNAVQVEGAFSEQQFFIGKGAGSLPTGAAVLSDISALTYNYKYEYKKLKQDNHLNYSNQYELWVYVSATKIDSIPLTHFTQIASIYNGIDECYVKGKISAYDLFTNKCFRKKEVSFIQLSDSESLTLEKRKQLNTQHV